jgi:hypothetical protein
VLVCIGKDIHMKKNFSLISLSLLIIILLASHGIGSDDWVEYSKDDKGNVYLYKKGPIDNDGGRYVVQVWEKKIYSVKGGDQYTQNITKDGIFNEGYDHLSKEMNLMEIDCKNQMSSVLSIVKYDAEDKELRSTQFDNPEWKYIVPDSRWETLQKKVCVSPQKKPSKKKK